MVGCFVWNKNSRSITFYLLLSSVLVALLAPLSSAVIAGPSNQASRAIVARDDMSGEYRVRVAHYRDETTDRFYSKTTRLLKRTMDDGTSEEFELKFANGAAKQLKPGRRLRITQGMRRGMKIQVDRYDTMAAQTEAPRAQRLVSNTTDSNAGALAAQVVYQRETIVLLISIVGQDGRVYYPALRKQMNQGTSNAELIRMADDVMWKSNNSIRKFYLDATHGKVRLLPELARNSDGRSDIYTYRVSWSEFQSVVRNAGNNDNDVVTQLERIALADVRSRTSSDPNLYGQRVTVLPDASAVNRLGADAGRNIEVAIGFAYLRGKNAYILTSYIDAIAHEIGHNLGLNHAGLAFGPENSFDAAYGDESCTMGYGINRLTGFNVPTLIDLSTYLSLSYFGPSGNPAAYVKTIDVNASSDYTTYNLYSVDATQATDDNRRQAVERDPNGYFSVRIPRNWQGDGRDGDFYYLSYRTNPQLDAGYRNGVNIHYSRLFRPSYLVATLKAGRDNDPNDFIEYGAVELDRVTGTSEPVTVEVLSENPAQNYITVRLWRGRVQPPQNSPPQARFDVTTSNVLARFNNRSTDVDGTIVSSVWDFGDGIQSTQTSPQHSYARNGTYTVSLTVRDDDGATNTLSQQVTLGSGNAPPTARFTFSANGFNVTFNDRSTDVDGRIVSWQWGFGDGSSSRERSPRHTYRRAGTYTVSLTVTDNRGLARSSQSSVTVTPTDTNPPAAPSSLSASARSNVVALRWRDNSDNETGFDIEGAIVFRFFGFEWASAYQALGRVPANRTSATSTLKRPGLYRYRVRAVNDYGRSRPSNQSPIVQVGG